MPGLGMPGLGRARIGHIGCAERGSSRSVADSTDRMRSRGCTGSRSRVPHEEGLQHDQPYGHQDDWSARMCVKSGWHENLSRGTLAQLIWRNHPPSSGMESEWQTVNRL
jgi:hypothetical protein